MQALLSAAWGVALLLALSGARVVSAKQNWHAPQTLFVFGDSFVDSGNLPRANLGFQVTRQWYYPYGMSYVSDDGSAQPNPTGRFSDFMVQSDFIAKMLGLPKSPPTYQSTHGRYCDSTGMNFAFASTGVNRVNTWINLREQINAFKKMIKKGIITQDHLTNSIALIGISGNDYKHFGRRNARDTSIFAANTTTEILVNVARLQNLGVKKILVNNLHPLGCTPWQTRPNTYDACDEYGNQEATMHNLNLRIKFHKKKGVLVVDLHTAFNSIIGHIQKGHAPDDQFTHRREPCCIPDDPKGFCGQPDAYSLCKDPSKHFFWDDMHPTHAGWEAVMAQLEDPIKQFIGVA